MAPAELAQQTMYLMAFSFMMGSLFTIFVLLILEMMRAAREARELLGAEADANAGITADDAPDMETDRGN